MVTSVELDDESYVNFVLDGAEGGNALIAAYDADGNIVWSWHIWYPEEAVSSVRVADSFDVMNMNLGALSMGTLPLENADCYGLLYQWGRKDPFPASATLTGDETTVGAPLYDASGNSVTIEYSSWSNLDDNTLGYAIAHPACVLSNYAHFSTSRDWLAESNDALWGNPHGRDLEDGEHVNLGEKSIYDPCPAGWRVPPADVFRSFTETGQVSWIPDEFNVVDLNADGVITADDFSYGWTFIANESESLFFPAAGRYDGSYAMLMGSVSGLWGSYWSNSPGSEDYGYTGMGSSPLSFQATMISPMASASRADAYSVRCVRE